MLEEYPVVEFLLLPGHHLYKMDYQTLIDTHRKYNADITVSVLSGTKHDQDVGFGIFKLTEQDQVVEYREHSLELTVNPSLNILFSSTVPRDS